MANLITNRPDIPSDLQAVTLDRRYLLRVTWRDRLSAWYADLYAANGDPIFLGQRVSALWALGAGLRPEGRPDGVLYIRAPDVFDRLDLGNSARIVFYPTSELPLEVSTLQPVTITIT